MDSERLKIPLLAMDPRAVNSGFVLPSVHPLHSDSLYVILALLHKQHQEKKELDEL